MSLGLTPKAFSPAMTSDRLVPVGTSARPIPGSSSIAAPVRGTTTVSPSLNGFGWIARGASSIRRVRLPCETATLEIRTSAPITMVPERWSTTTRALRSGSTDRFSIATTARAGDGAPVRAKSTVIVPESSIVAARRPVDLFITSSIRAAVVKSGSRRASRNVDSFVKSNGTSRSTRAPEGITPAVGTPWTTRAASPSAATPPAIMVPWATA